ncbi:hypothetical protein [Paraburkholderia bryophila]|uniref:Uncharacterized protein n=1 Tax=Paraburkholderia bryophila TaxID=420952 RepID=A0A329BW01_9BURK|nr:hypothetical protein [Paraburkholderia bryophila]RAS23145.1 hypothetical protein BX591_12163 [Paraburkholderia bryophila]
MIKLFKRRARISSDRPPREQAAGVAAATTEQTHAVDHSVFGDSAFRKFVNDHFDRDAYIARYPDVKRAGTNPVRHWLRWGLAEGREMSPKISVAVDSARKDPTQGWQNFTWKGHRVAVRVRPDRQRILDQIREQAQFDLSILSAGAMAIGALKEIEADDLMARDQINAAAIFASLAVRPRTVIAMPFLRDGGPEKYAAELIDSLSGEDHTPILILVTDDTRASSAGWESLDMLAPLRKHEVMFWRDACGPAHHNPSVLARFLNSLRPSTIVVNNSRIGLETIASFGRGLSQRAQLFCVYFDMGLDGLGAPYGARFPQRTLPFAMAVTDSEQTAATLRRMWGGSLGGPGIVELKPRMTLPDDQAAQRNADDAYAAQVRHIFGRHM